MFKFLEDLKSEYGFGAVVLVVVPWILSCFNMLLLVVAV